MIIKKPSTNNPYIDRMRKKRDLLMCDLHHLHDDMQLLKDMLRDKQIQLRKLNTDIIRKKTAYSLRVVAGNKACYHAALGGFNDDKCQHGTKTKLILIKGGQP